MIWLLFGSLVLADAIPVPADQTCPPGARLVTSHTGIWCVDTSCSSTADCYENEVCQATTLCVDNDEALDICEENVCSQGNCVAKKRCVTQDGTTNFHHEPICGCSHVKSNGLIALPLLAIFAVRRKPL